MDDVWMYELIFRYYEIPVDHEDSLSCRYIFVQGQRNF